MKKDARIFRLVESAVLLAVATVLSLIRLFDLPYGGSITACSALPLLLLSYRHGIRWGCFCGFIYALLQLLLGASVLSYCPTFRSVAAVLLLDYGIAFTAYGLGGVFRRRHSQRSALAAGAWLTGGIRYIAHVIAGCTVWAGLSIPTEQALLYSLAYNATYMIPETLVTFFGAWYFSSVVDIADLIPTRTVNAKKRKGWLDTAGHTLLAIMAFTDIVLIFPHFQNAQTGTFDITGLTAVPWLAVIAVTVICGGIGIILLQLHRR